MTTLDPAPDSLSRTAVLQLLHVQSEGGDAALLLTDYQVAIGPGRIRVAKFLLAQGLRADVESNEGETAHTALLRDFVNNNNEEALHTLNVGLEELAEECGFTKLHESAAALPGSALISPVLLQSERSEVNTADKTGMTPLHWASRRGNAIDIEALMQ